MKRAEEMDREELLELVGRLRDSITTKNESHFDHVKSLEKRIQNYKKAKRLANRRADEACKALKISAEVFSDAIMKLENI